ncbi:MAG: hypothetical protein DRN49_00150 [Thaumarchaeota archaeon]|mgnify:CR=1 FL=1|nr:MAG: hypothetical protein DRN49_00150 [Nitrososphaerota archaeon]
MNQKESKGQVREGEFGKVTADLFREIDTGHPPDLEVASFVKVERGGETQYGIVVNVKTKVPPLSEMSRGVDIAPDVSAEDKMYVDVYNPLADYEAEVVVIARNENGNILPGPKLTVTLPYSTIRPISDDELNKILEHEYFFLYRLVDEVKDRLVLEILSLLFEKLSKNKNVKFEKKKYIATVADLLTSLKVDLGRADVRKLLEKLVEEGAGISIQQVRMNVRAIIFPSVELKAGDLVAIKDYQSRIMTIGAVTKVGDGEAEITPLLQRKMDQSKIELASYPVRRGSIVYTDVKKELKELSKPRGPLTAIRIHIGNIYGTDLPYELELIPGANCHLGLVAISEGGKSNTIKVIAYQAIRHNLPLGMLIFDEHGEYVRSGEDHALDVLDPSAYILADPISDKDSRIPLHWIPLDRFLEGSGSRPARPAFRRILRLYYEGPGEKDKDRPPRYDRLSVSSLNWILKQGSGRALREAFKKHYGQDLLSGYSNNTLDIIIRELRNLSGNTDIIQIKYDHEEDEFRDLYPINESESYEDWEGRREHLLKKVFRAQKKGKIMILDVSAIPSIQTKMWLKRIILDSVVSHRRSEYRKDRAKFEMEYPLFLFVFEEATAAFDEETMARIREYRDLAVQSRKFHCGYVPVMQDPTTLDPVMLSQLQNSIILRIPQEDLRREMFRRLPSDATPFDQFIATAKPGQGIVVNPVKKGIGNLPVPVKILYFNDLILNTLKKAVERYKDDVESIVKETRLSKEFIEKFLKEEEEGESYEDTY